MRAYITLLGLLAMLSIVIQPAMAVNFSIYVFDSNSNMTVQNAFVRVWQDNNLLDNGNTDENGLFVTYLYDGKRYHIKAKYSNKWNETDYLAESAKSDKIYLYLHT